MWNLFKVNNKGNRTKSLTSFCCLSYNLWTDLIYCFGVSIVDFEQEKAGWVEMTEASFFRSVFKTPINILDGVLCDKPLTIIAKFSIFYTCGDPGCASVFFKTFLHLVRRTVFPKHLFDNLYLFLVLLSDSCIMMKNGQTNFKNLSVFAPQDFWSMFGHFLWLCMKELRRKWGNEA